MKNTHEIHIGAEMLNRATGHRHVTLGPVDPHTGQAFAGNFRGDEQVGDWVTVRKKIDAGQYEESRVQVIDRQTPVTGCVILTVRESAKVAANSK